MGKVGDVIRLIRVKQWVKNVFLFIPIFFAGEIFNVNKLLMVLTGFGIYCMCASAVYILNDIKDVDLDRIHPEKSKRPLASGAISLVTAYFLYAIFLVSSLVLSFTIDVNFFVIIVAYMLINVAYSLGLKKISILDLMLVSIGFVLRVVAGGVVADVPLSHWLIIMTFLLSLFIVLAKRRDDLVEFKNSGKVLRASSQHYNLDYIHSILTMLSAILITAYITYTLSDDIQQQFHTDDLYLTSIFVIAGVMRYIQITMVENNSGFPTSILYKDRFIHFTLVGWLLSFYLIIYVIKV
ncbi:decaprenyl-phosphate phosphoribosyltransferase [Fulvivirga ulvae]|uniref:decaprenyl-phosphate phosphoribosyltransferase n=1 Tax=Fulvivirga ulvae TaxID=2904245 RepID=UPI001F1C677C|nr:decaprenyl-phosphate phosphoribosyltransferase [Fulvivirga ulvae]UII30968.1 decaprenyl-phosphate phosphoribosyltransferase [Fulvivirga ulvae]